MEEQSELQARYLLDEDVRPNGINVEHGRSTDEVC